MLPVLHRKAHLSHSRFWEYREVNGNNYSCHFLSLLWTFILLASVGILFFFCMIGSLFSDMLIAILCWPVEKSSPCILFVSWGYHGLHWLKSVPFILSQSAGWQELWVAWVGTESHGVKTDRHRKMHRWSFQNNIWEALTQNSWERFSWIFGQTPNL